MRGSSVPKVPKPHFNKPNLEGIIKKFSRSKRYERAKENPTVHPDEDYAYLVRGIGRRTEEIVYRTDTTDREGGLPCREITEFMGIIEREKSYRIKKNRGNALWDKILFGIEAGSTAFLRTGFSPILLYDLPFAAYCLRTAAKNYIPEHTIDKIAPYFFMIGSVAAPVAYYLGMRMTNKKLETQDFVYMGVEFALSWGKAALDYCRRIIESDINNATYRQKNALTSSFKVAHK